jgi:NAD(P)-dependent dehydrogenase (short-subunit alcohol dehydrogenase family)
MLALNVRAAFVVAQAAARKMLEHPARASEGGAIVNVSSQMGHVGSPNRTVYCMTKRALEGLTKAMAVELAPQHIRANSLGPTFVNTPLVRRIIDTPAKREFVMSHPDRSVVQSGRHHGRRRVSRLAGGGHDYRHTLDRRWRVDGTVGAAGAKLSAANV